MNSEMIAVAAANPLFRGIPVSDMEAVLRQIDASEMRVKKGESIVFDSVRPIAVVLEGMVQIVQDDYWGTRSIIHMLMPGKTMGESFTTFPGANLNQKAIAQTDVSHRSPQGDDCQSQGGKDRQGKDPHSYRRP